MAGLKLRDRAIDFDIRSGFESKRSVGTWQRYGLIPVLNYIHFSFFVLNLHPCANNQRSAYKQNFNLIWSNLNYLICPLSSNLREIIYI